MHDQAKQSQTWWQKNKRFLIIAAVVIIVLLLAFALVVFMFGWGWTGFAGGYSKMTKKSTTQDTEYLASKTLWDWMQLLLVPIILAIGGFWLSQIQKRREEKATEERIRLERKAAEEREEMDRGIAVDNQHAAALQAYINNMSELLLEKHLHKSEPEDEVQRIARAQTLIVLSMLGVVRKRSVLQFLYESGLISKDKRIVDLRGANFRGTKLFAVELSRADLHEINLINAELSGADLSGSDLNGANLSGAFLSHANLSGASLNKADLCGANLSGADLSGAILSGAKYSTKAIPMHDEWRKPVTDKLGNPVMIGPTQWPYGFDPKTMGAICIAC